MNEQGVFEGSIQKMLLNVSHLYFIKIFQQMSGTGVHPGQIPLIRLIGRERGLNQKEISRRLRIKPPTVAVSIKRLEKIGIIRRAADEKDQRVTRIYLTDSGEKVYNGTWEIMKENEEIILNGFSQKEKEEFITYLKRAGENLEKLPVNENIKVDFNCGEDSLC